MRLEGGYRHSTSRDPGRPAGGSGEAAFNQGRSEAPSASMETRAQGDLNLSNRRVRTRTPGGVGGEQLERAAPILIDSTHEGTRKHGAGAPFLNVVGITRLAGYQARNEPPVLEDDRMFCSQERRGQFQKSLFIIGNP